MKITIECDTEKELSNRDKLILGILMGWDSFKKVIDEEEDETPPESEDRPELPPEEEDDAHPEVSEPLSLEEAAPQSSTEKKRVYKPKTCVDCNCTFIPNSGRAERCPECLQKHKDARIHNQRVRQTERRRAASAAKKMNAPSSVAKPKPEPPKTVACRSCHKPYLPEPGDKNFYCPKCLEKLKNRPTITPLRTKELTVEEVLRLPVVDRYKYAYMWTYQERQRALALKPVYPKPSPEEAEFYRRCATGDFMED